MSGDNNIKIKKIFVSYKDDNDEKREGIFELIEETISYIKIKSGKNIIKIPYHRINKTKEQIENE